MKLETTYFQQGLQDGQHDRQYGDNHSDRQQPYNANDLRAYQDGLQTGLPEHCIRAQKAGKGDKILEDEAHLKNRCRWARRSL